MPGLVFLELNELNFEYVEHYAQHGELPACARLLAAHCHARAPSEADYRGRSVFAALSCLDEIGAGFRARSTARPSTASRAKWSSSPSRTGVTTESATFSTPEQGRTRRASPCPLSELWLRTDAAF